MDNEIYEVKLSGKYGKGKIMIVEMKDRDIFINKKVCIDYLGYCRIWINDKSAYVHRLLLNNPTLKVDHINGDKLDNRRSNLRLCTQQQNLCNRSKRWDSKQKYKCINERKLKDGRTSYRVIFQYHSNGGMVRLYKTFYNDKEAYEYYNKKSFELYGEFSKQITIA